MSFFFSALFYLFLAASFVQLAYWLGPAFRLSKKDITINGSENNRIPVSIVICARNAMDLLKRSLPILLAQDYPNYELIVVDDGSIDGSPEWLRKVQTEYDRLRVIGVEQPTLPGKKAALTKGIQAARHPLVLLTDADCLPVSRHWIDHMQAPLRRGIEIGLGLGLYRRLPGFLNRFIRYEALYTGMQYLSLAKGGMPYMGVGRNLIYTRELFRRHGGLSGYEDLVSGDDDLFVNKAASTFNTTSIVHPQSLTLSEPKRSWRSYFRQKKRHLSVGRIYRPFHKMVLGSLSASALLHYGLGLTLLLSGQFMFWVVAMYACRLVAMNWVCARLWPDWRSADLLPWIPVLDLSYMMYLIRMAPAALWGRVEEW